MQGNEWINLSGSKTPTKKPGGWKMAFKHQGSASKERKIIWITCVFLGLLSGLSVRTGNTAESTGQYQTVIEATTATGWNRFFGRPIADAPEPVRGFGFTTIGKYNPGSDTPIPLRKHMPRDTVITNNFDPNFLSGFPVPPEAIDLAMDNVPLRDFPVHNDASGINRVTVPGILEAGQMELSQAEPAETVTLGDWMKARGRLEVTCEANGKAHARIIATNLLPNRFYNVLEWFALDEPSPFISIPGMLAGVPDALVTDENGNALFEADLNHCLPESPDDPSPSTNVLLVYHTDQRSYGGVPMTPLYPLQGRYPGEVGSVHLYFPTTGKRLVPAQKGAPVCEDVYLPDANLVVAPPIGPATGLANFVIGGKKTPATATVTFFAPPTPMGNEGKMSFFAQIRYDFGHGNVLLAKVDGMLTPKGRPGVFINDGNITYHGGTGIYKKAFGRFQATGTLSFADLNVTMQGRGLVCNRGAQEHKEQRSRRYYEKVIHNRHRKMHRSKEEEKHDEDMS